MIKEIYTNIENFVTDGYNVGVVIGILILILLIKFIHFVIVYCYVVIEDIIENLFKNTRYAKKVNKTLRIISNVITRGKFTDPKKDLWGFLYTDD